MCDRLRHTGYDNKHVQSQYNLGVCLEGTCLPEGLFEVAVGN